MRRPNTYSTVLRAGICLVAVFLQSGCLRRPLWVYTDEFRQVELITDWSRCDGRPGGMTAWFMEENLSGRSRVLTTAEVEHTWLNLPRGVFRGVVIDYSPAEYGDQLFSGMHRADSALVYARTSEALSGTDEDLFGPLSVPSGMDVRQDAQGNYLVSVWPDPMCADTLRNVNIITGTEGDLILWEERDSYEAGLVTQTLYAFPEPITWKVNIIVYISGARYMQSVRASLSGLSLGNELAELCHTGEVCLHSIPSWEQKMVSEEQNTGYVTTSIHSFGLPEQKGEEWRWKTHWDSRWNDEGEQDAHHPLPPLRLNLQFLLRDELTVLNYHYDLSWREVSVYPEEMLIEIVIPPDYPGPALPYVDAKDSAGFDADVSPWEDGGTAEVVF